MRIIPLFLILILAICLRAYQMQTLSTFRGDQAIELTGAANILKGKFTLIGIKTSISEVRNGAVMYYLLTPLLYLFKYDPIAGGVLQTILQLGSIILIYYVGCKYFNVRVAGVASFLMAGSSLLVLYSRQTLLAFYPLFFCTLLLMLGFFLNSKSVKYISLLLGIVLGFSLQVHFSIFAVFFWLIILPLIQLSKRDIASYYLQLFLGICIGFSPFLLFEVRHQFFNTQMLLKLSKNISYGSRTSSFFLPSYWLNVLSKFLFGGDKFLGLLAVVTIVIFSFNSIKERNKENLLCISQILCTIFFTLLFVRGDVSHYMLSAFPSVALIFACIIDRFLLRPPQRIARVSGVLLGVGYLAFQIPAYGYGDDHGYTMHEGWNVMGVAKSAQIIKSHAGNAPYDVVMVIDAENQALPLRYFLDLTSHPPLSETEYDKAKLLYVVTEQNLDLSKISMYEINAFGAYQIKNIWEIQNGIHLYELIKKQI